MVIFLIDMAAVTLLLDGKQRCKLLVRLKHCIAALVGVPVVSVVTCGLLWPSIIALAAVVVIRSSSPVAALTLLNWLSRLCTMPSNRVQWGPIRPMKRMVHVLLSLSMVTLVLNPLLSAILASSVEIMLCMKPELAGPANIPNFRLESTEVITWAAAAPLPALDINIMLSGNRLSAWARKLGLTPLMIPLGKVELLRPAMWDVNCMKWFVVMAVNVHYGPWVRVMDDRLRGILCEMPPVTSIFFDRRRSFVVRFRTRMRY